MDAEFTGVCPDCRYMYTEPVHPFPSDSLPCCPKCGSRRRPYPVGAAGLPSPPDLVPVRPEDAWNANNASLLVLLLRDIGYRMGAWVSRAPRKELAVESPQPRTFSTGPDPRAGRAGVVSILLEEIEAAWEVGDRPGHHG